MALSVNVDSFQASRSTAQWNRAFFGTDRSEAFEDEAIGFYETAKQGNEIEEAVEATFGPHRSRYSGPVYNFKVWTFSRGPLSTVYLLVANGKGLCFERDPDGDSDLQKKLRNQVARSIRRRRVVWA